MGKPASPARKEGVGGALLMTGVLIAEFAAGFAACRVFCAVVRRVLFRKRRASCAADCAASEPLRCQVTPSLHNAPCRERKRDLCERRKGKPEARLRKRTEDTRAKSQLQNYELALFALSIIRILAVFISGKTVDTQIRNALLYHASLA